MKKVIAGIAVGLGALAMAGCTSQADTVSHNISQDAEQFKVERRIVFFNGITDNYLLTIEGRCSVETGNSALSGSLEVTCKVGEDKFMKHFLGLSDNVSYLVEQTEPYAADAYHYKVLFRPEEIIPDIDLDVSSYPDQGQ